MDMDSEFLGLPPAGQHFVGQPGRSYGSEDEDDYDDIDDEDQDADDDDDDDGDGDKWGQWKWNWQYCIHKMNQRI